MALLHAIQLFVGAVTTTSSPGATIYTPDSTHRIILRNIQIRNPTAASITITFRVGGVVVFTPTLGAGQSTNVQNLWWVLMPGNALQVQVSAAGGVTLLVSGSIYSI